MMPKRHALMSLGVGLVGWRYSRSLAALPLSFLVGTLVDLDHIVDYAWYVLRGEHRLILPLHSYELVPVLWLVVKSLQGQRVAVPVVASFVLHLLSDELENHTKPGAYSLVWRAIAGFSFEVLSRRPVNAIQGRRDDLDGLRHLISGLGQVR